MRSKSSRQTSVAVRAISTKLWQCEVSNVCFRSRYFGTMDKNNNGQTWTNLPKTSSSALGHVKLSQTKPHVSNTPGYLPVGFFKCSCKAPEPNGGFLKLGYPKIIHFSGTVHDKPSIWGTHIFGNHKMRSHSIKKIIAVLLVDFPASTMSKWRPRYGQL